MIDVRVELIPDFFTLTTCCLTQNINITSWCIFLHENEADGMFQKLLHFDFANFKIHFHGMQNVYNILLAPRNLFRYVNKTYRLYLYFLNSLHIGHVRFVACACCIMCCSNSYLTIYWVLGRYKYKHSF